VRQELMAQKLPGAPPRAQLAGPVARPLAHSAERVASVPGRRLALAPIPELPVELGSPASVTPLD
jgi:hypothetical protein